MTTRRICGARKGAAPWPKVQTPRRAPEDISAVRREIMELQARRLFLSSEPRALSHPRSRQPHRDPSQARPRRSHRDANLQVWRPTPRTAGTGDPGAGFVVRAGLRCPWVSESEGCTRRSFLATDRGRGEFHLKAAIGVHHKRAAIPARCPVRRVRRFRGARISSVFIPALPPILTLRQSLPMNGNVTAHLPPPGPDRTSFSKSRTPFVRL